MVSITPHVSGAVADLSVSENAPKEIRGRVTGLFQFVLAGGVMISYWIPYGCAVHIEPSSLQWRIPIAFQIVPAGLMIFSLFWVKESPRWLAFVGRQEEAIQNLAYLRKTSTDDPELVEEFTEIMAALEEERRDKVSNPYRLLMRKGQWPRLAVALAIMFFTQVSFSNYGSAVLPLMRFSGQVRTSRSFPPPFLTNGMQAKTWWGTTAHRYSVSLA